MTDNSPNSAVPSDEGGAGASPVETLESSSDVEMVAGRTLAGRYRMEECMGTGAMGEVYRAEHTLMKKTVAVKILHTELMANEEIVERFQREAQAAANIDHPNICAATDFGRTEEGAFFLVMEYLEGETLEEVLLREGDLSVGRALNIAIQICDALERAHSMGIIHRDLKPENIMLVERDGVRDFVKILDFGVAHVRLGESSEGARLTQAGVVYGTPEYMSPEQATGDVIDARSDLYAVGVILYEMLAGRVPFRAEKVVRVLGMHLSEEPPPMSEFEPEAPVPPAIEAVVRRLLAKDPADRYEDAATLREVLSAGGDPGAAPSREELVGEDKAGEPPTNVLDELAREAARAEERRASKRRGLLGLLLAFVGLAALALVTVATVGLVVKIDAEGVESLSTLGDDLLGGDEGAAADEEAESRSLEELRSEFTRDEKKMRAVLDLLAADELEPALAKLEKLRTKHADNPHFHYYVGVANAREGNWDRAIGGYREAIEREPRYSSDSKFRADLVECLESCEEEQRAQIAGMVGAADGRLADLFAEIARTDGNRKVRKRAREALEEKGALAKRPEWERVSIQLMTEHGCKRLGELLDRLAAIGDRRGLAAVQYYDELPKKGCGFLDRKDCYGCIRDEISNALEALEKAPPADGEAADDAKKDGSKG